RPSARPHARVNQDRACSSGSFRDRTAVPAGPPAGRLPAPVLRRPPQDTRLPPPWRRTTRPFASRASGAWAGLPGAEPYHTMAPAPPGRMSPADDGRTVAPTASGEPADELGPFLRTQGRQDVSAHAAAAELEGQHDGGAPHAEIAVDDRQGGQQPAGTDEEGFDDRCRRRADR